MPGIEWDDKYSVHVALIDEQHKKIFELLNKLSEAADTGQTENVLPFILDEAAAYANYHFTAEEFYMAKFGYPELPGHQKEHESFRESVERLRGKLKEEGKLNGSEVASLLSDWLAHHILTVDMKFGPFLNSKGIF